jgi:hypothetical protein
VRPESLGIFWCNREACKKHRIAIEVVKSGFALKKELRSFLHSSLKNLENLIN